jgi:hypothetical protein
MPDPIRIDSLPVIDGEEPRDLINFQRLVDGVWQDFHTDLATFYGNLRTFVHTFELDTLDTQVVVYSPEADELAVPITLLVKYTPGDNPTDNLQQISFDNSSSSAVVAEFTNGSSPLAVQPVDVGAFAGLDTDILLILTSNGGNGTAFCIATYAILPKV